MMSYIYGGFAVVIVLLLGIIGIEQYRVKALEAQIETIKAQDGAATARFLEDRDAKQKELQNAQDQVNADHAAKLAAAADAARVAANNNKLLKSAVDCYASGHCGAVSVPAQGGSCDNSRADVLDGLLDKCLDVLSLSQSVSNRAIIQIHSLTASLPGATK